MLNHHPHFKLFIKLRAGAACTSFLINFFLDSVVISLLPLPPSTRSNQSHVCLWSGNYPSQSEGMFGRLREEWLVNATQHAEDNGVHCQKESVVWFLKQLFDTRDISKREIKQLNLLSGSSCPDGMCKWICICTELSVHGWAGHNRTLTLFAANLLNVFVSIPLSVWSHFSLGWFDVLCKAWQTRHRGMSPEGSKYQ